eukprot:535859_1
MSLDRLKYVDIITNKIIYGYIHIIETQLFTSNCVPVEVINLCIFYYYIVIERFNKNLCGKDIQISSVTDEDDNEINMKIVTHNGVQWSSVCGCTVIDSVIYPHSIFEWTLKLHVSHDDILCTVGIIEVNEDSNKWMDTYCFCSQFKHYGNYFYGLGRGYKLETHDSKSKVNQKQIAGGYFLPASDHTMKMILDTENKTLQYVINQSIGYKPIKSFKNIDLNAKYLFAISVNRKDTKIEIMDFMIKSNHIFNDLIDDID